MSTEEKEPASEAPEAPEPADPTETHLEEEDDDEEEVLDIKRIRYAMVRPVDIPSCVEIEKASYPPTEAASKSSLQYRQHHAAPYFRCAFAGNETMDGSVNANVRASIADDEDIDVIGFICATRCHEFTHESMTTHHAEGPLLAIHSVVVTEEHRNKGVATAMLKDYVETMRSMADDGVQKIVLMAKKNLLSFYVDCGFSVIRPSPIEHGKDQWYELELDLSAHKSTGYPYSVVDAFANVEVPGSGNPAAVVMLKKEDVNLEDPALSDWMLLVAKEFNVSETAFVWQHEEHKQGRELHFNIRYFSTMMEVDLCGHATLAAAGILYRTLSVKNTNDTIIVFHAKNDVLYTQLPPGGLRWIKKRPTTKIAMRFPVKYPEEILFTEEESTSAVHKMVLEALNVQSEAILFMGITAVGDMLVELTPEAFESIGYDNVQYSKFLEWDGYTRGVAVCCVASPPEKVAEGLDETASTGSSTPLESGAEPVEFLSRFFAPKIGINEDPATGSAHCSLGPYFSKKLGKDRVLGKQASERGAILECRMEEDGTVTIIGVAVQTMAGNLLL